MSSAATLFAPSALLDLSSAAFAALGIAVAAFSLYMLIVAVAALFHSGPSSDADPRTRLTVLVPAHNESHLISRCVLSLLNQDYPKALYQVVVIADNCSDDTAAAARAAGAHAVMTRDVPTIHGKGPALRWAMDQILPADPEVEALVVVDADSIADAHFLRRLVGPFEAGASAVQGESLLYGNDSPGAELRAAAFLLVNRVRPAGRAVLGLPMSHLAGNGMLLGRELLETKPWAAFSSAEDLEYSLMIQAEGRKIAYAAGAILSSPAAPTPRAAAQQQLRWEGGKLYLARTQLPGLIRRAARERRLALLGVAFDLAVPPLGLLAVAAVAGTAAVGLLWRLGVISAWALTPWLGAVLGVPLYVLIGLRAAGAPRSSYRALAGAPLFLLAKPARTYRALRFRGDTWVRTERGSEGI